MGVPVTGFSGDSRPQGYANLMRWANPSEAVFDRVKIFRKVGAVISGSSDPLAKLVYEGRDQAFVDFGRDFPEGSLKNGTVYHYAIFSLETNDTESTQVSTTATPSYTFQEDNVYWPTELRVIIENGLRSKGFNPEKFDVRETDSIDPHELGEKDMILIYPLNESETERNLGDISHEIADSTGALQTAIGGIFEEVIEMRAVSLNSIRRSNIYRALKAIIFEQWERLTAVGAISRQLTGGPVEDDWSGQIIAKEIYSRALTVSIQYDFLSFAPEEVINSVVFNYFPVN